MKRLKSLISFTFMLASLTTCNPAHAQTNGLGSTTNLLGGLGFSQGTVSTISAVLQPLIDSAPYWTNGDVLVEAGGLKHGSHWGGLLSVQVPINTNSWQVSYGFAGAYLDHQAYSGAIPVSLGTTLNVPYLSKVIGPLYGYVESGPGYNIQKHQIIMQSFIGVKYAHDFTPKFGIDLSAGYGNISDVQGNLQAFTAGFHWKF